MLMNQFDTLITTHNELYSLINKYKDRFKHTNDNDVLVEQIEKFKNELIPMLDHSFAIDEKALLPVFKTQDESISIKCILDLHKYIFKKIELLKELLNEYSLFRNGSVAFDLLELANDIIDDVYNYSYSEDCIFSSFLGIEMSDEEKLIIARDLAKLACNLKMSD